MKFLKYLLLLILIVVVGMGIYTTLQPSEYDFSRSKTMEAPAQVLFENVDDYKKRVLWDPWVERDPSIKITYGEKVKGPGATYSWTSDEGDGTITRTESVPYDALADELDFGSMGKAVSYWNFETQNGSTKVTWGMKGQNVPFIMKFFGAISGGYEGMMGPVFDRGLERLDSIAQVLVKENEVSENSFTTSEVTQLSEEAIKFIGYEHTSKIDQVSMQEIYAEALPNAGEYAIENGLDYDEFVPGAIFYTWDEEKGETEFIIGVFLKKDLKAGAGMKAVTVAGGNKVRISKFGNYGVGDMEAHALVDKFVEANNLTINGAIYEMYVNDPTAVEPNEIQTDIYYPVN